MSTGKAVQQGWNQQTHVTRHMIGKAMGKSSSGGTTRRRKKKAAAASAPRKRRAKRVKTSRKSGSRLVKGSAAAKAWGAKMKRARKKR